MLTYKYYNFRHTTVESVPNPTNTSSFFKNKFHKIRIFTPLHLILLLTKDTKDFLKYLENSQILIVFLSGCEKYLSSTNTLNFLWIRKINDLIARVIKLVDILVLATNHVGPCWLGSKLKLWKGNSMGGRFANYKFYEEDQIYYKHQILC